MARPLQDGQVEYDDGTVASTTQMAKDVAIFLNWAAEPEHDDRKKMGTLLRNFAPQCSLLAAQLIARSFRQG